KTIMPAWVSSEGPAGDVAISTRARLARNLEDLPFPCRARDADLKRVADRILDAVHDSGERFGKLTVLHPRHMTAFERLVLVDSHFASGQHVTSGSYRPVVLNESGTLSLMVNEEDHLRIQCILPGLQPLRALEIVREFDAFLEEKIKYARTDNYGYLTASLSNIGTGLRLSVMLHLAGLTMLREAVSTLTAATQLKISVRGLFGEGTKALGDLFQVSNETTIGFSEKEITSRVRGVAEHLIAREREARRIILRDRIDEITELVNEVRARLLTARALSGEEALAYLSVLRLGAALGMASGISMTAFNELLASMQVGATASIEKRGLSGVETAGADTRRARQVREKLATENTVFQLAFPEQGEHCK
ncbi:MAG: hypothetical protein QME62_07880, partial [Armatimonadota bacterium]|nr:hypothetical protein [Armatimonadota bacterium]